jgi:hypothetical protein
MLGYILFNNKSGKPLIRDSFGRNRLDQTPHFGKLDHRPQGKILIYLNFGPL